MMQLAVTGLTWCYFFVWLCDENHLEVIEFDEEEWQDMKNKMDSFYFDHFLEWKSVRQENFENFIS